MSFINDACRAENLQQLLNSPRVPEEVKELCGPFKQVFKSRPRGTRLNDALASGNSTILKTILANQEPGGRLAGVHKAFLPLAMEYTRAQSSEGQ